MSALSVCSGTTPSEYPSVLAISAPPSLPDVDTLIPLAPDFIALCIACFIALLKAILRSRAIAMLSATSCASLSGLDTSIILTNTVFPFVSFSISFLRSSIPCPPFPITIPGFPENTFTLTFCPCLSISILATPDRYSFFFTKSLITASSFMNAAKSPLPANHLESQSLLTPTLSPCGLTF